MSDPGHPTDKTTIVFYYVIVPILVICGAIILGQL